MRYETIEEIHRIAWKTLRIFALMVLSVGSVVGGLAGIGYLIFRINQHFHWGQVGIAVMTVILIFLFLSFMIAWSDNYNRDNPGQES